MYFVYTISYWPEFCMKMHLVPPGITLPANVNDDDTKFHFDFLGGRKEVIPDNGNNLIVRIVKIQ